MFSVHSDIGEKYSEVVVKSMFFELGRGRWTGETFIQDSTCTWFPRHSKGKEKKLWPNKDPDEGCKFWEKKNPS